MNKITLSLFFLSLCGLCQGQSKFSLQVNYGVNGNFFVRSYDESSRNSNSVFLLKKNFIGPASGIELNYKISRKSSLGIGYARTVNSGKKNYYVSDNQLNVLINDFKVRNIDNFYFIQYSRSIIKNAPNFKAHLGMVIMTDSKQEIIIDNANKIVEVDERTYSNSNSIEAGVLGGLEYSKHIDTKFELGLKTRIYYLISVGSLETFTITPVLTYHF